METVPMLLNVSYGGFGFSDVAIQEYIKRMKQKDSAYDTRKISYNGYGIYRFDPVMINVVRDIGDKANGRFAKLQVVDVIKEYIDYIDIDEYDGKETFDYDVSAYTLEKINDIIDSSVTAEQKVKSIKEVIEKNKQQIRW